MTLWINNEELLIGPGDGFQLPAGEPCRCADKGKKLTRVIWVYN